MTITINEDTELNHRGADDTEETTHDITINTENNIIDNINFNQESESIDESILKDSFTAVTDEDGDIIIDDSDAIFYTDEHKLNTNETRVNDEVNEDNVPDVQLNNGGYNLRPNRSNWRHKVFLTAIEKVKETDNIRYVYHLNIKQCKDKLGIDVTEESITKELKQMIDKQVWEPVIENSLSNDARQQIIPCKLFLKEKHIADGRFAKLKARLVAGGHRQNKYNYTINETSSPTLGSSSVLLLAAITAAENRHLATMDIGGAYLHASIKNDIYMRINKELSDFLVKIDKKV